MIYLIPILLASVLTWFVFLVGASVTLSPIIGIMVGTLISKIEYEDGIEWTLQFCFGIICLTIIWEEPLDG